MLTFILNFCGMREAERLVGIGARGAVRAVACTLVFVCAAAPIFPQQSTLENHPVLDIQVVQDDGNSVTGAPALPLKTGAPFDYAAERESLRQLYASGDYSDIHVVADSAPTGVRVKFVVERNFYNGIPRIEGLKEPPTEPAAVAAMRLNLGEPFRQSELDEGVKRLQVELANEGLYHAKITYDLTPRRYKANG